MNADREKLLAEAREKLASTLWMQFPSGRVSLSVSELADVLLSTTSAVLDSVDVEITALAKSLERVP